MSSDLHTIDRRARGFERAVLAYSLTGGDRVPIFLDRTLASLAGVRRWLAEVPGASRDAVRDYFVMSAATLCGENVDPQRVPAEVDAFERWITSEPTRGPLWQRPRTGAMKVWASMGPAVVDNARELALRMEPRLADGKEPEDELADDDDAPWTWSRIVDADELRADAEDEHVTVTITRSDRDALDNEFTRMYTAVVEVWGTCTLAVAYDVDEIASTMYVLRGLAGGLPRWLFGGFELEDAAGSHAIVDTDPPAYRVPFTRELVAALGMPEQWPHDYT